MVLCKLLTEQLNIKFINQLGKNLFKSVTSTNGYSSQFILYINKYAHWKQTTWKKLQLHESAWTNLCENARVNEQHLEREAGNKCEQWTDRKKVQNNLRYNTCWYKCNTEAKLCFATLAGQLNRDTTESWENTSWALLLTSITVVTN